MSSDERYLPPQSEDLGSRTGQEAPALWNPNAAACWSLLFSPIFGAALHMFNARAMGDAELEKLNKGFMWGTLAVLVIAILLAIFSGIKANFVGIAALGAWYGAVGRKQVALVKERYGSNYPRRSCHGASPYCSVSSASSRCMFVSLSCFLLPLNET